MELNSLKKDHLKEKPPRLTKNNVPLTVHANILFYKR